ncbi:MAG: hypothetical protein AAF400_00380 [Bacteroidota bacterium]
MQEDRPEVGVYMYVSKSEEYKPGKYFRDDLQDSIDICKEVAYEDYGVPLDAWEEIEPLIIP